MSTDLHHLLENDRFRAWVYGDAPEDEAFWANWAGEDPLRREQLVRARRMLLAVRGGDYPLSDEHVETRIRQVLREARPVIRRPLRWPWAVAASVAVLIGVFWGIRQAPESHPGALVEAPQEERISAGTSVRHVTLPDGSSVILQPGSELRYPVSFSGDKREVFLSGEAFFEVRKDSLHPFFAYAGKLITRVVGTSFRIRAYTHDRLISVRVKTGKVSVSTASGQGPVLSPNQEASLDAASLRFSQPQASFQPARSIDRLSFTFTDTPLAEVLATLSKAYGVTIVYDRQQIARCSINAALGDEPLVDKLTWICSITDSSFEVEKDRIVFTGKPCDIP